MKTITTTILFCFCMISLHAQDPISPADVKKGSFTDPRDGNTYETIALGEQVWMAENLNYITKEGSWAYEDKKENAKIYGRMYDGETAKTACPEGWHLPTHEEWLILEMNVGMGEDYRRGVGWRGDDWGNKLKSNNGWEEDGNGTDDYGFGALPAGGRYSDGLCKALGSASYFWTADGETVIDQWVRYLYSEKSSFFLEPFRPDFAMSVRCLKGDPPPEKKQDEFDEMGK